MLIHPTIENLRQLKLFGMIQALEEQSRQPEALDLTFEDRLGLLVDAQLATRDTKRLQSRLKQAQFRQSACVENIDVKTPRGLDKSLWQSLVSLQWISKSQNVAITGKTGAGKSYLACALGQKACREGFTCMYARFSRLFDDLSIAKATGKYNKLMADIAKRHILIIDDFALSPLAEEQRRDLLEILDDRYQTHSTIIVSQVPTDHWYQIIGDPTLADAILDRFIHNSHKIDLKGRSIREQRGLE